MRSATDDDLTTTVVSAVSAAAEDDGATVEGEFSQALDPDALDRLFRRAEGKTTLLFRLAGCEVSVSSDGRVVATAD